MRRAFVGPEALYFTGLSLIRPHPNEQLRNYIHSLTSQTPNVQFEPSEPEFYDDYYKIAEDFRRDNQFPSRVHEVPLGALAASLIQFSDHSPKAPIDERILVDAENATRFIKEVSSRSQAINGRVGTFYQLRIFRQQRNLSVVDSLYELAIISRLAARGADNRLLSGDISNDDLLNLIKLWHASVRGFDPVQGCKNAAGENYYFWTLAAWEAIIHSHPTASRLSRIVLGELFDNGPQLMHLIRSKIVKQPPHSKAIVASRLGAQVGKLLVI
ncbi:MAG: hypothetical protein AAB459_01385 [Patescibacteria group bacterium]